MVQFEKEGIKESFTIKVEDSGATECLAIIHSMLFFMSNCQEDVYNSNETYYMCKMIKSMLPTEDQIMTVEDAELLKELKSKRK